MDFRSHVHSFQPFIWRPFKSSTTRRRSRLQHGYCIGVSRRSAQATAGKGLAQGPYVTARAGVEPTTLRLRVIASTNAPSRKFGISLRAVSVVRVGNGRVELQVLHSANFTETPCQCLAISFTKTCKRHIK